MGCFLNSLFFLSKIKAKKESKESKKTDDLEKQAEEDFKQIGRSGCNFGSLIVPYYTQDRRNNAEFKVKLNDYWTNL
jgi:hypothetical protein